ncbi:MAG: agmatinase [Conexivisphaerales archaeon]
MSYLDLFLSSQPKVTNLQPGQRPVVSLFGVPYDVTTSYRPGCRFGPDSLREAFWKIEVYDPELDVDAEVLPIEDLGNLHPMPSPEQMVDAVSKVVQELLQSGRVPAIAGGEHSLTLGSFSQMPDDCTLLIFDAHFDLRDELYGWRLSHGTFLRRLSEKIGFDRFIHVGARAASREEWQIAKKSGLKMLTSKQLNEGADIAKLLDDVKRLYISVDLDVMDPAYAPGVGTPEPGGISSERLLSMLRKLKGKDIAGFDIVELDPPFDHAGITSIAAASVFSTLSSLVSLSAQR